MATVGAPGSGKSTWRDTWCWANPHATVVDLDRLRAAVSWCGCPNNQAVTPYAVELGFATARTELAAGGTVLWDAPSVDAASRRQLLVLAAEYDARTLAVVHLPPLVTTLVRNARRSTRRCPCGFARRVPPAVVLDLHIAVEDAAPALADEGWHVVTFAQHPDTAAPPVGPVEWVFR